MANDIVLTAGVRQNLLSLQNIGQSMSTTQERLATGKKINTPLDGAVNYFTSQGLNARAGQLNALLDSMSNAIQTVNTANNGITSIVSIIQSMQSTLTQARQDSSWQSSTFSIASGLSGAKTLTFSGGAVTGNVSVSIDSGTQTTGAIPAAYTGGTLTINGSNITIANNATSGQITTAINNAALPGVTATDNNGTVTISNSGGNLDFTGSTAALLTSFALPSLTQSDTVDQLAGAINANPQLAGFVKASDNAGQLQITNLSTANLTLTGITGTTVDASANTTIIGPNTVRQNLVAQFNQARAQLDGVSSDSSFNGVNLLQGDVLKVIFNEQASSTLNVQVQNTSGNAFVINSVNLGIPALVNANLNSNTNIDALLNGLTQSLNVVNAQASNLGSNLGIIQNRQDFTKQMVTTLQTGADNLVLADPNQEGANMLALQTRQQLSMTALSLANQANSAVLRLFG
jgi:flagellin